MKTYEKPQIEFVSLVAKEEVANDFIDGEMGVESAGGIFG